MQKDSSVFTQVLPGVLTCFLLSDIRHLQSSAYTLQCRQTLVISRGAPTFHRFPSFHLTKQIIPFIVQTSWSSETLVSPQLVYAHHQWSGQGKLPRRGKTWILWNQNGPREERVVLVWLEREAGSEVCRRGACRVSSAGLLAKMEKMNSVPVNLRIGIKWNNTSTRDLRDLFVVFEIALGKSLNRNLGDNSAHK